jgi:prevent-host-death family protein
MRLSTQIKPISYLKNNAAEIVRDMGKDAEPLIITQNGEAKAIVLSLKEYERMQETFALLQILAIGRQEIEDGEYDSAEDFFRRMDEERNGSGAT